MPVFSPVDAETAWSNVTVSSPLPGLSETDERVGGAASASGNANPKEPSRTSATTSLVLMASTEITATSLQALPPPPTGAYKPQKVVDAREVTRSPATRRETWLQDSVTGTVRGLGTRFRGRQRSSRLKFWPEFLSAPVYGQMRALAGLGCRRPESQGSRPRVGPSRASPAAREPRAARVARAREITGVLKKRRWRLVFLIAVVFVVVGVALVGMVVQIVFVPRT